MHFTISNWIVLLAVAFCGYSSSEIPPPSSNAMPPTESVAAQNCFADLAPPPTATDNPHQFFPWMAAIFAMDNNNNDGIYRFICTGSIISAHFVLTAAHCMEDSEAGDLLVRVGSVDKFAGKPFAVAERVPHTEAIDEDSFKVNLTQPSWNDIGLLKLETPMALDMVNVAPVCLGGDFALTEEALASGWGGQSPPKQCKWPGDSKMLQSGTVQIVPFTTGLCSVMPELHGEINDVEMQKKMYEEALAQQGDKLEICTVANGTIVEKGDSGGPLLKYEPGRGWRQLGITSRGDCEAQNTPVIYTKVGAYCEWIAQQTDNEAQCNQ